MLGMGNLPELQGHFFTLSGVLIYFQNLSNPIHWGKIKSQGGSSWQSLASETLFAPGGCAWPGRYGQGAVRGCSVASWQNSMLSALRGGDSLK